MYICLECGALFKEPKSYVEHLGPIGEPNFTCHSLGCPNCSGAYTETFKCDKCGGYVTNYYIQTVDCEIICDECFNAHSLEEDY